MTSEHSLPKPKALMLLYGHLESDGRAQRAAQALANSTDLTLMTLDSGQASTSDIYEVIAIKLPKWNSLKSLLLLTFWLRACIQAVRMDCSLVYAHDYYTCFAGWLSAKLSRARCVYDAHELIVPGGYHQETFRLRLFYWLERLVIHNTDLNVAAEAARARIMRDHYALAVEPLTIRNISDIPRAAKTPDEMTRTYPALKSASPDTRRLLYQGYMDRSRGIGHFMSALPHLDPSFKLILVGDGAGLDELRRMAVQLKIQDRVTFLGRVPRIHLYGIMRCCHIGIITYPSKGLNAKYCASNKVFEYAQAGLPVISTSQPPLKSLIRHWRIGVLVDHQTIEADQLHQSIAAGVQDIESEYERYLKAIEAFLASVNWEAEARQLATAVNRCLTTNPKPARSPSH